MCSDISWYFSFVFLDVHLFSFACHLFILYNKISAYAASPFSNFTVTEVWELFLLCFVCKYFLPVYNLPFHPLNRIFHRAEVLRFYEVKFIHFPLINYVSGVKSKNSLLSSWFKDFILFFPKRSYVLHLSLWSILS